jgi:hypothetical protein
MRSGKWDKTEIRTVKPEPPGRRLLSLGGRDRREHRGEHGRHAVIEGHGDSGKRDRDDAGQNCVLHGADTTLVPNKKLDKLAHFSNPLTWWLVSAQDLEKRQSPTDRTQYPGFQRNGMKAHDLSVRTPGRERVSELTTLFGETLEARTLIVSSDDGVRPYRQRAREARAAKRLRAMQCPYALRQAIGFRARESGRTAMSLGNRIKRAGMRGQCRQRRQMSRRGFSSQQCGQRRLEAARVACR